MSIAAEKPPCPATPLISIDGNEPRFFPRRALAVEKSPRKQHTFDRGRNHVPLLRAAQKPRGTRAGKGTPTSGQFSRWGPAPLPAGPRNRVPPQRRGVSRQPLPPGRDAAPWPRSINASKRAIRSPSAPMSVRRSSLRPPISCWTSVRRSPIPCWTSVRRSPISFCTSVLRPPFPSAHQSSDRLSPSAHRSGDRRSPSGGRSAGPICCCRLTIWKTRSTAKPSTGAHDRTASFHQGTAAAAVSALTGPV